MLIIKTKARMCLIISVADPDLDLKDPNHFAGAGSGRYFLSVGTSTIKSCKTNLKGLLTNIMILYFF